MLFLMHRVELKAKGFRNKHGIRRVFLMHRVELKVDLSLFNFKAKKLVFLMHRVELKAI